MSVRSGLSRRTVRRNARRWRCGPRTGGLHGLDVFNRKDGVKRGSELGVPVIDEELGGLDLCGENLAEIPGLLGHPVRNRLVGDSGAPLVVDQEEHIEPTEEHRVDRKEIASHQPLRLRSKELEPGRPGSPR